MALLASCLVVFVVQQAEADQLELRRLLADERGHFTVLFSLLDSSREPIVDVAQIPIASVGLEEGESTAEVTALELEDASLTTLAELGVPFAITVLLPDNDTFNGREGDESWPDASGLRSAFLDALAAIPSDRSDITLETGLYDDDVRWLPRVDATQVAELSAALMNSDNAALPGTWSESPFDAMENAFRTRLRHQARSTQWEGPSPFHHFFVIVTSADTDVGDSEDFDAQCRRAGELLDDSEVGDVTTVVIVYNPLVGEQPGLHRPEGLPMRFARCVTPEHGTFRIVGDVQSIREAMRQTLAEILSTWVLRFRNTDVEGRTVNTFRMWVDGEEERLTSNALVLHGCCPPKERSWRGVVIVGALLVGLALVVHSVRRFRKGGVPAK